MSDPTPSAPSNTRPDEPQRRCRDRFAGSAVIDDRGTSFGSVVSVVREPPGASPTWMVVETRWRRRRHYVPFDGVYPTPDGDLVVPFDRAWIKAAPRPNAASAGDRDRGGGELPAQVRDQLTVHYGCAYDWLPSPVR